MPLIKGKKLRPLKSITDILNKKLGYVPLWGHYSSFCGFHSLSKNITIKTYENMLKKHTLCYKLYVEIKIYLKTKNKTKEHNNRQNFNICIRNLDTNKERWGFLKGSV